VSASAALGQPEVVTDLEDLADDLVAVLLADTDAVHDLARGHRDLGSIDAVRAEHRAAAALRALVEVAVPVVEDLLGKVFGADELREVLPGKREIAAIDLAQQVLPTDRHVLRILGPEVVVTLVGAGTALDAGIQVDLQRTVLSEQVTHRLDGLVLPAVDQFTREIQRGLEVRLGDVRLAMRHRARHDRRHLRILVERGDLEICFRHFYLTSLGVIVPGAAPSRPRAAARAGCRPGCATG
jgi:hypothetical protein